jgi:DNA-binding beta-propeller fold protein YncE
MFANKMACFSVFCRQPDTDKTDNKLTPFDIPSQRFINHILFDRNLIKIIGQFIHFPLLKAPLIIGGPHECLPNHSSSHERLFRSPRSICIHPITGDLWVADTVDKCLCVLRTKTETSLQIQTIKCKGKPQCLRISGVSGHVVVVEAEPGAISLIGLHGTVCARFAEGQLKDPCGVAINDKLKQIAVTDNAKHCVKIFSYDGVFLRKLSTVVHRPYGVCWNENLNLLYVGSRYDHRIHVIDMKDDKLISYWGNGEGQGRGEFNWASGMMYKAVTQELLVADDSNDRIVVMDSQGNHTKSYRTGKRDTDEGQFSRIQDIALYPSDDDDKQFFICDVGNKCVKLINRCQIKTSP